MSDQLIILTAIGPKDRPGIVAALTRTVLECGGNLDDATMTRLHGAFATMIAARVDDGELANLREKLDAIAREFELHIALEPMGPDGSESSGAGPDHIITVYGADHPGIVHHVAAMLEEHGANITDLETHLTRTPTRPIYVMMVETSGGHWESLPAALSAMGRELDVDVSFSVIDEESL